MLADKRSILAYFPDTITLAVPSVYKGGEVHCGIVRLPDVRCNRRIGLMKTVIERYSTQLEKGAIITVRGKLGILHSIIYTVFNRMSPITLRPNQTLNCYFPVLVVKKSIRVLCP